MVAKARASTWWRASWGSDHAQALDRGVLMAQGGEFAFVLFSAAASAGVINLEINANFTAVVVLLSMALTPLVVLVYKRIAPKPTVNMDGVDEAEGLSGSVLLIGFGRFGQVASQSLLARDVDVTIIDNDVEMIQSAARFGFKIYYGDGTRLACFMPRAHRACDCGVRGQAEAADRIVELVSHEFPPGCDGALVRPRTFAAADPCLLSISRSARRLNRRCCSGQAALVELGADEDDAVGLPSRSVAAMPSVSSWRLPVVA